jgi:serine/threonine protein phosphatase PrpC
MSVIFFTRAGCGRDPNEDGILAGGVLWGRSMEAPMIAGAPGQLLAVADGMGGGPGGARAAKGVLEALAGLAGEAEFDNGPDELAGRLAWASDRLAAEAAAEPGLAGMGATVAGLWRRGGEALVFNCGDCRVYRSRSGLVDLMSRDHSTVYSLYLEGLLGFEQMRAHPDRHLITRAVQEGNHESIRVFTRRVRLRPDDVWLVCSDGVWEGLEGAVIEDCLSEADLEVGAWRLAEAALESSRGDDLSFVLANGC